MALAFKMVELGHGQKCVEFEQNSVHEKCATVVEIGLLQKVCSENFVRYNV